MKPRKVTKVHLLLQYTEEHCTVKKVFTSRTQAEKIALRYSKNHIHKKKDYFCELGGITYHVITLKLDR